MAQTPGQTPSPAAQAAKLRGILELAVTAIITIGDRGLIEDINPATERLFGYRASELIGQNVKMLMPEPYRGEHDGYIANYVGTGVKKIIGIGREVSGRRKDGTTFPLALVGQRIRGGRPALFHRHDPRHQRPHACRGGAARKRTATGAVAEDGGRRSAHGRYRPRLQQPAAGHHRQSGAAGAAARQTMIRASLLKEAQDAAALGSKLTDQLLTFARRRHMDAHVIQLNDLVVSIADMLRRTLGEHITLSTSLARDVWSTRADPGQFQSAIVNMAVNARDAMPQGGKLVVETRNIELRCRSRRLPVGAAARRVRAAFHLGYRRWDGAGDPRPRVRAVFYHQGKGPRNGARLGDGVRLRQAIGWPRHDLQRARPRHHHQSLFPPLRRASAAAILLPRMPATRQPVRETMLVVEDDSRVRQLTIKRLKFIGYEVLEASDGPAALEILKRGDADRLVSSRI